MDEKAKALGRRILRKFVDEDKPKMTDDKKALHQILAECIRPYSAADNDTTRWKRRQYRLDDIERIAGNRILESTFDKVSKE